MRNYYEMIAGLQERYLRPALERLLPVMAISCFGYLPEDLDFVFNPLATVTAEESEELAGKLSDRVEKLYRAGLLTYEEARSELKTVGEKYAAYSGIDPDAALQTVNVNEPAGLLTQAEKTGTMALEE